MKEPTMIDGFRQLCAFLDDTDPFVMFVVVPIAVVLLACFVFPARGDRWK
jgi:hypothetical protein